MTVIELFPHAAKNTQVQTRERFAASFAPAVGALAVPDVLVVPEDRKTPKSIGRFSVLPIVGNLSRASGGRPGESYHLPEDIQTTYGWDSKGRPYMDAEFGLGLVRDDWLVALSAANIAADGNIQVVQIQDVSGTGTKYTHSTKGGRFKSGLHDGFLWRDTLVASWIQLALDTRTGDKVTVQGAFNNFWLDHVPTERLEAAYDRVAERMGFTQNDAKNWEIELYGNNLVWPDFPE